MREIKFRAWNLTENRFLTTEELIYRIEVETKRQLRLDNNLISLGGKPDPSDEIIFQQYTGLKDKNGVEIYEGDIVEYTQHMFNTKMTRVKQKEIKYEEYSTRFNVYETEAGQSDHKVIGNIFEGVDK